MNADGLRLQIALCNGIIKKITQGRRGGNISYWKNQAKVYNVKLLSLGLTKD